MSIQICLTHTTEYHYDRLVMLSPQIVRLRPAPHSRTTILSYSLKVEPAVRNPTDGGHRFRLMAGSQTD